jgi:outer membrane protein assembly factor BamB
LINLNMLSPGTSGIEDSVIIGDSGSLYASYGSGSLARLQAGRGVVWRKVADQYPVRCPAVLASGDVVYGYGGMFGGRSELLCFSPRGKLRWKKALDGGLSSSPLPDENGNTYVAVQGTPGYILALDSGGQELWRYSTEPGFTRDIARGVHGELYAVWTEYVYCVGSAGQLVWKMKPSFGPGSGSGPAVAEDGRIVFVAEEGRMSLPVPKYRLISLDSNGLELWSTKLPERGHTPSIALNGDAILAFDNRTGLVIAYGADGNEHWRFQTGYDAWAAPLIDVAGRIYVNADDAVLGLDSDGNKLWEFPTKLDPATSPTLGADGTLYLGSWSGVVFALHD